jgi:hypothetical protein
MAERSQAPLTPNVQPRLAPNSWRRVPFAPNPTQCGSAVAVAGSFQNSYRRRQVQPKQLIHDLPPPLFLLSASHAEGQRLFKLQGGGSPADA